MNILIISPCFPPVNTPDHHRVRISIPWFLKMGHQVTVLAVESDYIEAPVDSYLKRLPDPCRVIRVKAFSTQTTRKLGLGNLGYRCWWQMLKAGNKLLKRERYDVIYFSTTVFPVMTLGRVWKQKFKVPFVLDFQDPWRNDFYLSKPKNERPPKFAIAHFLDSMLEKWTVPHCNGVIAVSEQYPKILADRYNINLPHSIITFSATLNDFKVVDELAIKNAYFSKSDNRISILYIGVVPPPMLPVIDVLFKALAEVQKEVNNIDIYFLGTSYDINASSVTPVKQLSKKNGLVNFHEQTNRISHFKVIHLLKDASIMLVPGTIDEGYTASKIYPYILSEKPIVALTHELSSVSTILKGCNTGPVITFKNEEELHAKKEALVKAIRNIIELKQQKAHTNWEYYVEYSDRRMAEKQMEFFEKILDK